MKRFLLTAVLLFGLCGNVSGQTALNQELDAARRTTAAESVVVTELAEVADGDSFHRQVIVEAMAAVKRGEMKRVDLIRLRVAMISPAFREAAKDLAIVQMSASGVEADGVPIGDDGQINEVAIDWSNLGLFLEKLLPFLLALIKAFGGMADIGFELFQHQGLMHANIFLNGQFLMMVS